MSIYQSGKTRFFTFAILLGFVFRTITVNAELSSVESSILSTTMEKSIPYEREHVMLIWPEKLQVNWYSESNVQSPEQLADWLEKCYVLCVNWIGINPNQKHNARKKPSQKARLIFVHNGMRDYNFGGEL